MGLFIKVPLTPECLIHSSADTSQARSMRQMLRSSLEIEWGPFSLISFPWIPCVSVEAKKKPTDKIFV